MSTMTTVTKSTELSTRAKCWLFAVLAMGKLG